MSAVQTGGVEVDQLVARAFALMTEALDLLDQVSAAHSAALLDNAIAVLPAFSLIPGIDAASGQPEPAADQSDSRSSILR